MYVKELHLPLYRIVAKFNPTRFGNRKLLRWVSHVPSPTYIVLESYVLLPGGAKSGEGDIDSGIERARMATTNQVDWRGSSFRKDLVDHAARCLEVVRKDCCCQNVGRICKAGEMVLVFSGNNQ